MKAADPPTMIGKAGEAPRDSARNALLWIYLVNAALLLCHEIDSAVWREWELFRLPGGATGFVAVHLLLVPLILCGLAEIATGGRAGRWLSLVVGLGGLAGAAAHTTFLLLGDERFSSLFSTALIAAFGLASVTQVATTLIWWRVLSISGGFSPGSR